MNKTSDNQHVRKMKNRICLMCSGMAACPRASFTVNGGKGSRYRNCSSCLLPPHMALVFHAGGTFMQVGFVYSQNELKRAISETVLTLTKRSKALSLLGSIARGWHSGRNFAEPAAFQNNQLAHVRTVHLPQENYFCTSLFSNKQAAVEENSRRWWRS